tara:strand:+ start:309 stop:821 length:513 start_codon:yes stop_codon:yes gene_type:complete
MEQDFLPMNNQDRLGIAPLVEEKPFASILPINESNAFLPTPPTQIPDPKKVLGNIIRDRAIEYAGKKLGISQLGNVLGLGNYLGNVFGLGLGVNPIAVGIGALAGGIRSKYNAYKQTKRDKIARDQAANRGATKQLQLAIDRGDFDGPGASTPAGMAAANQDAQRGGQYG